MKLTPDANQMQDPIFLTVVILTACLAAFLTLYYWG